MPLSLVITVFETLDNQCAPNRGAGTIVNDQMNQLLSQDSVNIIAVSVIIPMRNAESYVAETLKTIIAENGVNFEIVVVDDGSTDSSREIVLGLRDPRIHLIGGPKRGVSACFNVGLEFASGQIIMPCDADDLFASGRILTQYEWLRQHPEAIAVCGRFSTITSTGKLIAPLLLDQTAITDISNELAAGIVRTSFCTYAVRKVVFDVTGCWREYFETAQDIDMQLRIGEFGRVDFLPENFYMYRLHEASVTHQQPQSRRRFYERMAYAFQIERRLCGQDSLQAGSPPEPPNAVDDTPSTAREQIRGMLTGQAWSELASGHHWVAVKTALRAALTTCWSIVGWTTFVKIVGVAFFAPTK